MGDIYRKKSDINVSSLQVIVTAFPQHPLLVSSTMTVTIKFFYNITTLSPIFLDLSLTILIKYKLYISYTREREREETKYLLPPSLSLVAYIDMKIGISLLEISSIYLFAYRIEKNVSIDRSFYRHSPLSAVILSRPFTASLHIPTLSYTIPCHQRRKKKKFHNRTSACHACYKSNFNATSRLQRIPLSPCFDATYPFEHF